MADATPIFNRRDLAQPPAINRLHAELYAKEIEELNENAKNYQYLEKIYQVYARKS
jgi:hypothetical protein